METGTWSVCVADILVNFWPNLLATLFDFDWRRRCHLFLLTLCHEHTIAGKQRSDDAKRDDYYYHFCYHYFRYCHYYYYYSCCYYELLVDWAALTQ